MEVGLCLVATVDRADPEVAFRWAGAGHDQQERKRGFALSKVIAGVLAQGFAVAGIVERIVYPLKNEPKVLAKVAQGRPRLGGRASRDRARLGGRSEELGRLGLDDVQINLLR